RDRTFEVAIIERMVLDLDREPLVMRVERGPPRHRPGLEHAVEFEPQIIMQSGRGVFLDDEAAVLRERNRGVARGLRRLVEIPLLAVGGEIPRRHGLSCPARRGLAAGPSCPAMAKEAKRG